MTIRFYPTIVSLFLLLLISACATSPVSKKLPSVDIETEAGETKPEDLQLELQRDPSDRSLVEIDALTKSMSGYQPEVALEIIRSLESIPSGQLMTMIYGQMYDPEFTEWLELALQVRTVMIREDPVSLAAQRWSNYHYGHVVTQSNFPALVANYKSYFKAPSQVAVLLPAEGGLTAAGRAIRDGIISAYMEQPGESVIRFYSSGKNSESAISAYQQASEDGATQIVGPLRIESARALASLGDLSVPVLLLNDIDENDDNKPMSTVMVNSLSLSQAEEAAAIASQALTQAQKHAIVIVPDSAWGRRIEAAFTTVFLEGGGKILAVSRFSRTTGDHNSMLTGLLNIDESVERKKELQSWLGIQLEFEATRRNDFDCIFLAASPAEGRELKPLLRFHDAGDVPVYAMGRVFSGKSIPTSDQDLNGIVFPVTKWQLRAIDTTELTPESLRDGSFGNLYALGRDAWRVLPWLHLMQRDPDLWFAGDIGDLQLQMGGHLQRQPGWAQFVAGQAIPFQWPVIQ